jgi:hypothetical protein
MVPTIGIFLPNHSNKERTLKETYQLALYLFLLLATMIYEEGSMVVQLQPQPGNLKEVCCLIV